MRYAIYYSPARDDLLAALGARWLGRDMFSGQALQQPLAGDLDAERFAILTRDPRRYGFHATLKAPFRLADGITHEDIVQRFDAFAVGFEPFEMPDLAVARLGGFLALMPSRPVPELERIAASAVENFDDLRAPPSDEEIARRRPDSLSERERELLDKWGYPYVFDAFRFHMTLSGYLDDALEAEAISAAARRFFQPVLERPAVFSTIALCVEPAPAAPFRIERFAHLGADTTHQDGSLARLIG